MTENINNDEKKELRSRMKKIRKKVMQYELREPIFFDELITFLILIPFLCKLDGLPNSLTK